MRPGGSRRSLCRPASASVRRALQVSGSAKKEQRRARSAAQGPCTRTGSRVVPSALRRVKHLPPGQRRCRCSEPSAFPRFRPLSRGHRGRRAHARGPPRERATVMPPLLAQRRPPPQPASQGRRCSRPALRPRAVRRRTARPAKARPWTAWPRAVPPRTLPPRALHLRATCLQGRRRVSRRSPTARASRCRV
jgi:hypothetical protein